MNKHIWIFLDDVVLNLYIVCHVFVMIGPEYYKAAYLVLGLDFYALLLSIDISCTGSWFWFWFDLANPEGCEGDANMSRTHDSRGGYGYRGERKSYGWYRFEQIGPMCQVRTDRSHVLSLWTDGPRILILFNITSKNDRALLRAYFSHDIGCVSHIKHCIDMFSKYICSMYFSNSDLYTNNHSFIHIMSKEKSRRMKIEAGHT